MAPFLLAICTLPMWFNSTLVSFLTFLRLRFSKKERRLFHDNIRYIWKLKPKSHFAEMFVKQVFYSQILILFETLKIAINPKIVKWEGYEDLEREVKAFEKLGSGQIVVTAHLGSWELVGFAGARAMQHAFYTLAKPAKLPLFTKIMHWSRRRMQCSVLWSNKKMIQRQMIKAVKDRAWLGFVMDQKPAGRNGPAVQFWGKKTEFVGGPAKIAIKFQKAIIGVFCVRIDTLHYKIISKVIFPAGHGESDPIKMTQKLAHEIEKMTRMYPEQWCWNYKRWKFNDIIEETHRQASGKGALTPSS
mgnify:CR=1 FL=1